MPIIEDCKRINHLYGSALIACVLLIFLPNKCLAQKAADYSAQTKPARTLVIGFVGGFVHSDDRRHSEVQLAQHLQTTYADNNNVQVQVFRNRQRAKAHYAIVAWFNEVADQVGPEPRVILFGHSWGASAVVYLARELERDSIPVALTIQVDSVQKLGQDDSVIPANVAEAINFYQSKGLIHGHAQITAADPVRTAVLGNFHFQYKKEPADCHAYPWYNRLLFKGHTSIECDPRVWSQVDRLIETRLAPEGKRARPEVAAQLIK
jgi:pimeloyl-ACP methyl ester carboxylesterase